MNPFYRWGGEPSFLQHTARKWQNEDVNPDLVGSSTVESSFVVVGFSEPLSLFLSVHEGQGHDCKSMIVKQQPPQSWEFMISCNFSISGVAALTCPMKWAGSAVAFGCWGQMLREVDGEQYCSL